MRKAGQLLLLVALAGCTSCCGGSPQGPTPLPPRVSGHVYQFVSVEGEPMLSNVLITIEQPDGSRSTTRTNAAGFYTVAAVPGRIAITARKLGYESNRSEFELADDTVLNFSLRRNPPDLQPGLSGRLP